MAGFVRKALGAVAMAAMVAGTVVPAQAGNVPRMVRYYAPPPGMVLTKANPRNALALRASYQVPPALLRQVVPYKTTEKSGTLVVNTEEKFLYFVLGGGRALRYGIGVARTGFEWSGTHRITDKREWPSWTPPAEMRKRQPGLPKFMEGGPNNPLGARALYIGSTLYRIHGTNEPWTIGGNVSSGCIRMTNDDVIDLFDRVKPGSKVIVM